MARWKTVFIILSTMALLMAATSAVMAKKPNPCDGPAGQANPNCVNGVFEPAPCTTPAGKKNKHCIGDLFKPDGGWVIVDEPSSAAGDYVAVPASFGPQPPEDGISGTIVLVNDNVDNPNDGCEPLDLFPIGAIALIDRGACPFVTKVMHAQEAGAIAVIVINNVAGNAIVMGGSAPNATIPAVMVSQSDGNLIKNGLPATGTVRYIPTE